MSLGSDRNQRGSILPILNPKSRQVDPSALNRDHINKSDLMSPKATTDASDTNVGVHPHARNDAPATRVMFLVIALLFIAGTIIAVLTFRHYNGPDLPPVPEEQAPPLKP